MPLHAYECESCKTSFEKLVRAVSRDAVSCPVCESTAVTRQLSMPAKPLQTTTAATNCAGTGPPCGATFCGRRESALTSN